MYPPEVVIAEKLHGMVVLDIRNSRMKDYYDLWYMVRTQPFELKQLRESLEATFVPRGTPVPTDIPFALTEGFLLDEAKKLQWRAFLRRLQLEAQTPDLLTVGRWIANFVGPLLRDSANDRTWRWDGGWLG